MSSASIPHDAATETPSDLVRRVAQAKASFSRIRGTNPYQDAVVAAFDEVRLAHIDRDPGTSCGGAMLVAPFGTGKTEALVALARHAAKGAPEGTMPVLNVVMRAEGTPEAVPSAILAALGAPKPDAGRPSFRWDKAIREMKRRGVQLATFDEFNRAARRVTMSRPIATVIQERIMDAGVCPVAFVGSEEADIVLKGCPALLDRLDDGVSLDPFDWSVDEDQRTLVDFLDEIDGKIVAHRLLATESTLERHAERFVLASGGRMRVIMKVIRNALGEAVARNAEAIDLEDLAFGFARLPLADREARNPFEEKTS